MGKEQKEQSEFSRIRRAVKLAANTEFIRDLLGLDSFVRRFKLPAGKISRFKPPESFLDGHLDIEKIELTKPQATQDEIKPVKKKGPMN